MAQVSRAIAADHTLAARYTWANRLVAVVSDGSAVLGLGDIGPAAALPVMEGKCALFKEFAGLDAIPIVLDTKDPDEIVETLVRLRPTFGAVNLEDISAPRCFEIERRVIEALDCPVMHDDQHGTAIVVLAALMGATKLLGRDMTVAAGGGLRCRCGRCRLLESPSGDGGFGHHGARLARHPAHRPRRHELVKADLAQRSNPRGLTGGMVEALDERRRVPRGVGGRGPRRADRHDGARAGSCSRCPTPTRRSIRRSRPSTRPWWPPAAATSPTRSTTCWRSPGCSAARWTPGRAGSPKKMKVAAAEAIFSVVSDDLAPDRIVPSPLDLRVGEAVAAAVAQASQAAFE